MAITVAAGAASVYSRGFGSYDPYGQQQAGRPFTVLCEHFNRGPVDLSRNAAGEILALEALLRSKGGLFALIRREMTFDGACRA